MNEIILSANDDRFGFIDESRNLIYPSRDVFDMPIRVRSSMHVVWVGQRFVCFPSQTNTEDYHVSESVPEDETYAHADNSSVIGTLSRPIPASLLDAVAEDENEKAILTVTDEDGAMHQTVIALPNATPAVPSNSREDGDSDTQDPTPDTPVKRPVKRGK